MINFDHVSKGDTKEQNPNFAQIPYHSYKK